MACEIGKLMMFPGMNTLAGIPNVTFYSSTREMSLLTGYVIIIVIVIIIIIIVIVIVVDDDDD